VGNPLDTKQRGTLLDLDDLLADRTGKLLSTPRGNRRVP
jgi:hypothetical protein